MTRHWMELSAAGLQLAGFPKNTPLFLSVKSLRSTMSSFLITSGLFVIVMLTANPFLCHYEYSISNGRFRRWRRFAGNPCLKLMLVRRSVA
jgi:hypothetical protein